MALKDDLETKVAETFQYNWEKRDGRDVPDAETVGLGNKAVNLDATVLYADLSDSTGLVDNYSAEFAAEIYKTYLYCAARIIENVGGTVTAYDGDRVMGVFTGKSKNTSAVKAAMKINAAVNDIINPKIIEQYGEGTYTVKQVIGVDTSKLLVAKTGVRGANDLVWVGKAANYAAKLCAEKGYSIFITEAVYKVMNAEVKFHEEENMWVMLYWENMDNVIVYATTYQWGL